MKKTIQFISILLLISCNNNRLSKEMGCEKVFFPNLETIEDVHKNFSIKLPNNWKTNLYYDNSQSSIYAADTTKQLTETYLVDVTMISNKLNFNSDFYFKYKNNLTQNKLVETNSFETPFLKKEAFYSRALGKKSGFPYQIINLYIKVDNQTHIHAKAEVYGDSLANERLCEALTLIEKTTIKSND